MRDCLNETTVSKYVQFAINVFGVDPALPPMEIALLSDYMFNTLGLKSTLTEQGIGKEHFAVMARKACGDDTLPGFQPLRQADIETIFTQCL